MLRRLFAGFFSILFCLCSSSMAQTFIDIAPAVGLTQPHQNAQPCDVAIGTGSAWADADNDGDIDLYITNHGGANWFYRNEGDTNGDSLPDFVDIAAPAGVDDPGNEGHACVFIDYDNDGDQDLMLTNRGNNILFHNNLVETGSLQFTDVTAVAGIDDPGLTLTASWGDFDRDGYLDLYLAKHRLCLDIKENGDKLFRNNGDGTFTDVTHWLCPDGSASCDLLEGYGFSAGWIDYDNDADPDIYLVNDIIGGNDQPNVLWRNDGPDSLGNWQFIDVSLASGANIAAKGMGLGVGDYDNDGWLDVAFSNIGPTFLLRNNGDGTFSDVSAAANVLQPASVTWGTVFFDHDNDSWPDLLVTAGSINPDSTFPRPNLFFGNNGNGTFSDLSQPSGLDDSTHARNAAIVDIDHDGFVDVLITNLYDLPLLYHNRSRQLGNTNNWLTITLSGTVSNADAIGSRLWLTTVDGVTRQQEITSGPTLGGGDFRAAYFGLGNHSSAELIIRWPNGRIEDIGTVTAGQQLHFTEPLPVTASISVDSLYLPVPAGGDTFPYQLTVINHTDETAEVTIEATLTLPGGQVLPILPERDVSIVRQGTLVRSPLMRINSDGPAGDYLLTLTWSGSQYSGSTATIISKSDNAPRMIARLSDHAVTHLSAAPNPFNPSTQIRYSLQRQQEVTLTIYNLLGQRIRLLQRELLKSGGYEVTWDGRDDDGRQVASGMYVIRLQAGEQKYDFKIMLKK